MSLGPQREKGVVYVGSKAQVVYEKIIEKEFEENKHIELRVLGRAVTNAIRICEKLVNAKKAVYTRLYSETIDYEGKPVVRVIIKLKRNDGDKNDNKDRERDNTTQNKKRYRDKDTDEHGNKGRDNTQGQQEKDIKTQETKPEGSKPKRFVEKKQ